ncbi:hypothetical protein Lepto7375DRAFT_7225 [Leptolyngbya sp. PCC 7375]|nr:hypothetical protein Lepto7375DRAFT_7225 [Leptolyngbya sp. PCC 7375]
MTTVYVDYLNEELVAEPLRDALHRIVGLKPPEHLTNWKGLVDFSSIDDDYLTYQRVCDWVNDNYTHISWLTIGGVVDSAVLLVERAIENGNIREIDSTKTYDFNGFIGLLNTMGNYPTPDYEEFMQDRGYTQVKTKDAWMMFESMCSEEYLYGN